MAIWAEEALFAAIEIHNKPRVAYREQTLALLLVNAWEILLKARIVQLGDNKLQVIQRRGKNSRSFMKTKSGRVLTIGIDEAAEKAHAPQEVRSNLEGLCEIRDEAAHLGRLAPELKERTRRLGSAAVRNFIVATEKWFDRKVEIAYLLPLGFLTNADTAKPASVRQRQLLDYLTRLGSDQPQSGSDFAVSLRVDIQLTPDFSGGGTIGVTDDPAAPKVQLTDAGFSEKYPLTYKDVVKGCRELIPDFKQNPRFHQAMRTVKQDPELAYERRLDPNKASGTGKYFYARATPEHVQKLLGHN